MTVTGHPLAKRGDETPGEVLYLAAAEEYEYADSWDDVGPERREQLERMAMAVLDAICDWDGE